MTKILVMLRQEPNNLKYLLLDNNQLVIRALWLKDNGEWKSTNVPLTAAELENLAGYVKTKQFSAIKEEEREMEERFNK